MSFALGRRRGGGGGGGYIAASQLEGLEEGIAQCKHRNYLHLNARHLFFSPSPPLFPPLLSRSCCYTCVLLFPLSTTVHDDEEYIHPRLSFLTYIYIHIYTHTGAPDARGGLTSHRDGGDAAIMPHYSLAAPTPPSSSSSSFSPSPFASFFFLSLSLARDLGRYKGALNSRSSSIAVVAESRREFEIRA